MIKIVKGDLLKLFEESKFDVIIHGCNCQCTMGAGIAKQIADKYPYVSFVDEDNDIIKRYEKLSNYTLAGISTKYNKNAIIVNLYTQLYPGKELVLPALELGMYKLSKRIPKYLNIGMPKIGCGIAGGDWNEVLKIIEKYFYEHKVTIIDYDKN